MVIEIQGYQVTENNHSGVLTLLSGAENTFVQLKVLRKGVEISFSIKREKILERNVSGKMLPQSNIGYIKVKTFMEKNTTLDVLRVFEDQLRPKGAASLILDLRDNGGGLLSQGIELSGLFVGRERVVGQYNLLDADGNLKESKRVKKSQLGFYVPDHEAKIYVPLVVLVNENSASASEIFAGAIQDHERGWIVGERTFGKGTIQAPVQYEDFSDVLLYRTIARFYQPSGRTNQIKGIIPDFEVFSKPNPKDEDKLALREEYYYPTALKGLGKKWHQTRKKEVKQTSKCVNKEGVALEKFDEALNDEAVEPDFQLWRAMDFLDCLPSN